MKILVVTASYAFDKYKFCHLLGPLILANINTSLNPYPRLVLLGQKFSFNLEWLFPTFFRLFRLVKSASAHLVRLLPPHITAVSQALQITLASLLLEVHPLQTHL